MTQLFFDNASTLLGVLGAIFSMTGFGVPLDVINEVGTLCEASFSDTKSIGGRPTAGIRNKTRKSRMWR